MHIADIGDNNVFDAGIRQYGFRFVCHISQHNQRFGTGIVKLVFHLTLGVQRIGIYHHHACAHCTKDNDWVLQDIGQLNGDTVTRHQSGFILQVGSKCRTLPIKF